MLWNDAVKSTLYTVIKAKLTAKYGKTYSDMSFGTDLISKSTPKFPNISIHRLPGVELGHTLDKTGINGILTTYQIDVSSNKSESVCSELAGYIAEIMVGDFMFEMVGEPYPDYESTDTYKYTMRFRRAIGASDSL